MREAWAHTSSLHGGLLKYPIFRDISEIKRMRKQCVPGVLSPLPSERLGTRLISTGHKSRVGPGMTPVPSSLVKGLARQTSTTTSSLRHKQLQVKY